MKMFSVNLKNDVYVILHCDSFIFHNLGNSIIINSIYFMLDDYQIASFLVDDVLSIEEVNFSLNNGSVNSVRTVVWKNEKLIERRNFYAQ